MSVDESITLRMLDDIHCGHIPRPDLKGIDLAMEAFVLFADVADDVSELMQLYVRYKMVNKVELKYPHDFVSTVLGVQIKHQVTRLTAKNHVRLNSWRFKKDNQGKWIFMGADICGQDEFAVTSQEEAEQLCKLLVKLARIEVPGISALAFDRNICYGWV